MALGHHADEVRLSCCGSSTQHGGVVARAFDDDVEKLATIVVAHSSAGAERSDSRCDAVVRELRVGPQTNKAVQRPSEIPHPSSRCGEVPIDERPTVRADDEVPWREIVVSNNLRRSAWISAFLAPLGSFGWNEVFLSVVIVSDQPPNSVNSSVRLDQVKMTWVHAVAGNERQDFAPAIVGANDSWRRV